MVVTTCCVYEAYVRGGGCLNSMGLKSRLIRAISGEGEGGSVTEGREEGEREMCRDRAAEQRGGKDQTRETLENMRIYDQNVDGEKSGWEKKGCERKRGKW